MPIFRSREVKVLERELDRAFSGYRDGSLSQNVVNALIASTISRVQHQCRVHFADRAVPAAYAAEYIERRWRRKLQEG